MPKTGYRPNGGRPPGSRSPKAQPIPRIPLDIERAAHRSGLLPLDYMLEVMRDEPQDTQMRARMAIAAAPYLHAKPGDIAQGKKAAAEAAAATAGHGTEWGDDLVGPRLDGRTADEE